MIRSRPLLKGLLSAFAVFHIAAVAVLPNPESILYRELRAVVSYGSFFGFNTTWRFFSPNPGMKILEYEVFTRNAEGVLESELFQHPNQEDRQTSVEIFNRKLTNAMFVVMRPENHKPLLGRYLCRRHPNAEQIAVYVKGRQFESMAKARLQGEKREDIGKIERVYIAEFYCDDEEIAGLDKDVTADEAFGEEDNTDSEAPEDDIGQEGPLQ